MVNKAAKRAVVSGGILQMRWIGLLVVLVLVWVGETAGQHSANIMINSGFVMRAADTPAKLERLRSFPKDKFVARKTRDGRLYYIYADPDLCVCAYVGTPQAMASYREKWNSVAVEDPVRAGRLSGQQLAETELIHDMSMDETNADIDYQAFTPLGPMPAVGPVDY
jgi:hypothetical protein